MKWLCELWEWLLIGRPMTKPIGRIVTGWSGTRYLMTIRMNNAGHSWFESRASRIAMARTLQNFNRGGRRAVRFAILDARSD